MIKRPSSRTSSKQRGQSIVEFALVLPLMLAIIIGGLDVCVYQWRKIMTTQAVYAGAQLASQQYDEDQTEVLTEIRSVANFVGTADVSVDYNAELVAADDAVAVQATISGPWSPSLIGMPAPRVVCRSVQLKEEREFSS